MEESWDKGSLIQGQSLESGVPIPLLGRTFQSSLKGRPGRQESGAEHKKSLQIISLKASEAEIGGVEGQITWSCA